MARTAESLFTEFFLPNYPPDAASDLAKARSTDANPANNPELTAHLADAAARFQALMGQELGIALDGTDASIHHLGVALTAERREAWIARGDLFNIVVHGAAYLGRCIEQNHGGTWRLRRPMWESLVFLKSQAGEADLPVFHWWLKALSDDDLGTRTLGDRYRTYVEEPTTDFAALPVLAKEERTFPRLSKVRYDVFYKYMKANAPEIKDFGSDFPSAERFAELEFKWLEMRWVGGGRMLLVYGLSRMGFHLFWLDAKGFRKSAFMPCDAFPEPVVRFKSDKIEVIRAENERTVAHEMLWWGL